VKDLPSRITTTLHRETHDGIKLKEQGSTDALSITTKLSNRSVGVGRCLPCVSFRHCYIGSITEPRGIHYLKIAVYVTQNTCEGL
jgi:hypothetical protein